MYISPARMLCIIYDVCAWTIYSSLARSCVCSGGGGADIFHISIASELCVCVCVCVVYACMFYASTAGWRIDAVCGVVALRNDNTTATR